MTFRPNFPLTATDMDALAVLSLFPANRRLVQEQLLCQEATIRLAAMGVPLDRAGRITSTLGYHAAEGLADTIARSGVTLDQIADAITDSGAEIGLTEKEER